MPKAVEKAVCNVGLIKKLSCKPRREGEVQPLCGEGIWGRQPIAENRRPVGLRLSGRRGYSQEGSRMESLSGHLNQASEERDDMIYLKAFIPVIPRRDRNRSRGQLSR